MVSMKRLSLALGIILFLASCEQIFNTLSANPTSVLKETAQEEKHVALIDSLKIEEAFLFCKKQKLDSGIAFFVDMRVHSGKARFFIYDFKQRKIIHTGLCCHGFGQESTCETPVFSNVSGSNCTSLGKYKTGLRAYSNWGINIHYKLHGLESTNSNAFQRLVVLHSYDLIEETEIYPSHLPLGWSMGCPVISNNLMTSIDTLLQARKKPVLLWIYN